MREFLRVAVTILFALSFGLEEFAKATTTLAGVQITSDVGITSGEYVEPNEHSPYYFLRVLDKVKGGALVSTGNPFRTFIDASYGNFEWVFMVDFDTRITDFNIAHNELVRAIAGTHASSGLSAHQRRLQYVAALNFHWLTPKQLATAPELGKDILKSAKYFAGSHTEPLSDTDLEAQMAHMPPAVAKALWQLIRIADAVPARGIWEEKPGHRSGGFWGFLIKRFARPFRAMHEGSPVSKTLNAGYFAKMYWADDSAYEKIENLVVRDRIVPFTANWVVPDGALAKLALALKALHTRASVLDLSNVLDHLARDAQKEGAAPDAAEKLKTGLLHNLNALSNGQDALILLTTELMFSTTMNLTDTVPYMLEEERHGGAADSQWNYIALHSRDFYALLKSPEGFFKDAYVRLISHAYKTGNLLQLHHKPPFAGFVVPTGPHGAEPSSSSSSSTSSSPPRAPEEPKAEHKAPKKKEGPF